MRGRARGALARSSPPRKGRTTRRTDRIACPQAPPPPQAPQAQAGERLQASWTQKRPDFSTNGPSERPQQSPPHHAAPCLAGPSSLIADKSLGSSKAVTLATPEFPAELVLGKALPDTHLSTFPRPPPPAAGQQPRKALSSGLTARCNEGRADGSLGGQQELLQVHGVSYEQLLIRVLYRPPAGDHTVTARRDRESHGDLGVREDVTQGSLELLNFPGFGCLTHKRCPWRQVTQPSDTGPPSSTGRCRMAPRSRVQ